MKSVALLGFLVLFAGLSSACVNETIYIGGCNESKSYCNSWTTTETEPWMKCIDICKKRGCSGGICTHNNDCPSDKPYKCRCYFVNSY
ncbi:hypothetical protein Btru_074690 [Bulinus truncatus]|nr:hypothetical protein Btru_074690 [Bulinus truncatus]